MLYKPVDLDNFDIIRSKALAIIADRAQHGQGLFYIENHLDHFLAIDELRESLDNLGFLSHVHSVGCYIFTQHMPSVIHRDSGSIVYSLNLPLQGCDNTLVNFYHTDHEPELRRGATGVEYHSYDRTQCRVIDRLTLTQPHIINVQVPHAVINRNSQPRITLLIRLKTTVGNLF